MQQFIAYIPQHQILNTLAPPNFSQKSTKLPQSNNSATHNKPPWLLGGVQSPSEDNRAPPALDPTLPDIKSTLTKPRPLLA